MACAMSWRCSGARFQLRAIMIMRLRRMMDPAFSIAGCVDQSACNFDPNAIQDDGSCIYPLDTFGVEFLDCNGNCLNDNDGDGVCDEEEIQGCMDSNACDYNEAATDQLLPCIYPDAGYNCEGFCLFDFDEDGICDEFDSCPEDPENDLDGDGVCSNDEIEGCTNEQACNFIPTATEEDGSCLLVETICGDDHFTCDCTCISDIDGGEICDEDVPGCQEMSACNFNPDATDSDGTCEWATCAGCIYSLPAILIRPPYTQTALVNLGHVRGVQTP